MSSAMPHGEPPAAAAEPPSKRHKASSMPPAVNPPPHPNAPPPKPRMQGGSARGSRLMLAAGGAAAAIPSNKSGSSSNLSTGAPPKGAATAPPAVRPTPQPRPEATITKTTTAAAGQRPPSAHWPPKEHLPPDHAVALDNFLAIERTLPLLRARGLPPLFGLLVKPVESGTRRTFTPNHLAAIVGVWPEAYAVTVAPTSGLSVQRARLSATSGQKWDWHIELPPSDATASSAAPPAESVDRVAEFRQRLDAYAGGRALPVAPLPPLAPAAEEAAEGVLLLTSRRLQQQSMAATAPSERLLSARAGGSSSSAAASAASAAAVPSGGDGSAATTSADDDGAPPLPSAPPLPEKLPPGCEGLPPALLAKVLQRQASQQVRAEEAPIIQRAALMRRLPQMAAAMRSCMHEAGKRVMGQAELVKRLTINGKWLASADELREQMRLVSEIAPRWCTLVQIGGGTQMHQAPQPAVRLDPEVRFSEVLQAIKEAAAREEMKAHAP